MLEFQNVSLQLGGKDILREVSLSCPDGCLTALMGKNGSGKSSLAACALRQRPYRGQILLEGHEVSALSPRECALRLGHMPQHLPAPNLTVRELASMGRAPRLGLQQRLGAADREAVDAALCRTGLCDAADRLLPTLSGGERQRAFLAMLLCQDAPCMILDEPTAHLDADAAHAYLQLLSGLAGEGRCILLILHDLSLALRYAERVAVLSQGCCEFCGTRQQALACGVAERTFGLRRISIGDAHFFTL